MAGAAGAAAARAAKAAVRARIENCILSLPRLDRELRHEKLEAVAHLLICHFQNDSRDHRHPVRGAQSYHFRKHGRGCVVSRGESGHR